MDRAARKRNCIRSLLERLGGWARPGLLDCGQARRRRSDPLGTRETPFSRHRDLGNSMGIAAGCAAYSQIRVASLSRLIHLISIEQTDRQQSYQRVAGVATSIEVKPDAAVRQ